MRVLRWVITNGFGMSMLWFGGYQNIVWAKNIFLFIVWFTFIVVILCSFSKEAHQKLFDKGLSVPSKVSVSYDIIMTLGIVALGWFVIAIIYVISSVFEYTMFTTPPKKDKKE